MNPMDLKRGVDMAVDAVVGDLKKNSKKLTRTTRSLRSAPYPPMAMLRSGAFWLTQ
jgi:chaperonin GroEL (HSP60 family)